MKTDFYARNERYAANLRAADPRTHQSLPTLSGEKPFHQKYADALAHGLPAGAPVLDVGCGAGQVVRMLAERGYEAHGVEVSEAAIELARAQPGRYQLYDGRTLPLADASMRAVGAFNVLEHVEEPVRFLDELARVLRPGGRMVVSSPNFLRVAGWRDYHPHMRGWGQKWRNLGTLRRHRRCYRQDETALVFEPLTPIFREPMEPDDDATVATNLLDLVRFFELRGFGEIRGSCVDRPVPRAVEWVLDATPLRYGILNAFVTATKPAA